MKKFRDRATAVSRIWKAHEADPEQPGHHFARKLRGVPDVADLQVGEKRENLGPIGTGVTGYRRLGVALGPVLHVAGFRGYAAVQAGAIPPFGVELDPVGRSAISSSGLASSSNRATTSGCVQSPQINR